MHLNITVEKGYSMKMNRGNVAISPRKPTDRGGYYCMPLRRNIPIGKNDWKLIRCPKCGAECWEIPLAEIAKAQGATGVCTMCALKDGISGGKGLENGKG